MSRTVCPAKSCGVVIDVEDHMCMPHWIAVPPAIAKRVVRAFQDRRRSGSGAAYQDAIAEACKAVEAKSKGVKR